jgi:acyl carrier protein
MTVDLDAALGEIWCRLLGTGAVTGASNFFLDGGDSSKLVELALELKKRFAVDIPIMTIFEAQTFGNLAAEVGKRVRC